MKLYGNFTKTAKISNTIAYEYVYTLHVMAYFSGNIKLQNIILALCICISTLLYRLGEISYANEIGKYNLITIL